MLVGVCTNTHMLKLQQHIKPRNCAAPACVAVALPAQRAVMPKAPPAKAPPAKAPPPEYRGAAVVTSQDAPAPVTPTAARPDDDDPMVGVRSTVPLTPTRLPTAATGMLTSQDAAAAGPNVPTPPTGTPIYPEWKQGLIPPGPPPLPLGDLPRTTGMLTSQDAAADVDMPTLQTEAIDVQEGPMEAPRAFAAKVPSLERQSTNWCYCGLECQTECFTLRRKICARGVCLVYGYKQ